MVARMVMTIMGPVVRSMIPVVVRPVITIVMVVIIITWGRNRSDKKRWRWKGHENSWSTVAPGRCLRNHTGQGQ